MLRTLIVVLVATSVQPAAKPQLPLTLTRVVPQEDEFYNVGSVSRDGRFLSVVDESQTSIGLRDVAAAQTRILVRPTEGEQFGAATIIAPSGDRVIYLARPAGGPPELRAVPINGGNTETVYQSTPTQDIQPLAWSNDGAAILAQTWQGETRSLILIRLKERKTIVLKPADRRVVSAAAFSTDATHVAFDMPSEAGASDRDVFVVESAGGTPAAILGGGSDDHLLGWLSDGQLAFISNRHGISGLWMQQTKSARATGPPRLVCEQSGRVAPLGVTHDGRVFGAVYRPQSNIYFVDLDPTTGKAAGSPVPAPTGIPGVPRGQATWSRDGKQIAYTQHVDGTTETILVHDVLTGRLRVYPVPLTQLERPDWYGDGQAIAVKGVSADGALGVFRLDLASGDIERIAERGNYFGLAPDGQVLFYTRPENNVQMIWRKDLNTGAEIAVDRGPRPATKLSPDGKSLALYVVNAGKASIVVVPSSGGERRVVTDKLPPTINTVAWSHNGQYIYVVAQPTAGPESYAVWRVAIGGGEPESMGFRIGWVKHISVRPDGRQMALSVVSGSTEVWSFAGLTQGRDPARR